MMVESRWAIRIVKRSLRAEIARIVSDRRTGLGSDGLICIYGSETADYVMDEAVQSYGGYGFCAEYPVERYYRDNRINRLFEGTNEINRIVIGSMLLRKAAAGQLALFDNMAEAAVPAQAISLITTVGTSVAAAST